MKKGQISSATSPFRENRWLYNFSGAEFINVEKLIDDESKITVEESTIPVDKISVFMVSLLIVIICVVWRVVGSIQETIVTAILGALAVGEFLALLYFVDFARKHRNLFFVCKEHKLLHLDSGKTIKRQDILCFRQYVSTRQNFKLVLLSVAISDEDSVLEAPVIAMIGELRDNEAVGKALSSYFGVPVSTLDARYCKKLRNAIFG